MSYFLQNVVFALSDGGTYALIALGYTMVYGVLRLINFAHGDVFMLGAYAGAYSTTASAPYTAPLGRSLGSGVGFVRHFIASFSPVHLRPIDAFLKWITEILVPAAGEQGILQVLVSLIVAMVVCGVIGYVIERFAYRPLRRSPPLSALITAIGVSLLIEYLAQIEWHIGGKTFFGPSPLRYPPLAGTGKSIDFFTTYLGITVLPKDLIIVGSSLVAMLALWLVVQHTRHGKAMRAVSLNYDAARLMGININRVISFTFVLGSMLAAIGGCLYGLNYNELSNPLIGLPLGLKAFVAAVIGGIGNIPGAAVGGFTIAFIETFVSTVEYHHRAILTPYKDGISFVILIAVLLIRPEGIFGKAVAEKPAMHELGKHTTRVSSTGRQTTA